MNNKFNESIVDFKNAFKFYESKKDGNESHFAFLALAKTFEISIEYAWKELKKIVEDEGLEAPSPKEAIRKAAKIGKISEVKLWFRFIEARNIGTHDYFGLEESEYLEIFKLYLEEIKIIFSG
ncbi:MAG: nucleotidyltransferase substrate binding protein [Pseudomonadota bacterium]